MLKGIKKSVPTSEDAQDHPKINPTAIKNQSIMEEQNEIEDKTISQSEQVQQMKKCYQLFLSGQPQKLTVELSNLQKLKETKASEVSIDKKSKFSYEFNAQDKQSDNEEQTRKRSRKDHSRPIMQSNRISEYCKFCPDNEELVLLSASNYVYLALPALKTFPRNPHFILAPVDHEQSMLSLNEDVLTEIQNYKKCLIQMYDRMGMHLCFFEQFSKDNTHGYIQCLAIDLKKSTDLPFFFKQGLEGIEGFWNTHQSIIKIEKEKGGIQKQLPKKLKYFYIDFGLGYGYAHVIQNQKIWKRDFANQILATALGIQKYIVKTTEEWSPEQLKLKKQEFIKIWKKYDWTVLIQ